MIVSVVNEAEWLSAFSAVPHWTPPGKPLLIVAPHPDDETLGAGGLIAAQRARGLEVVVAAVTDGEKAYPDSPELAGVRRGEQEKALARLGVAGANIHRFGLPDGHVKSRETELAELLTPLVSEGTHVIAPWVGDFHPDHEACGRAAERVVRSTGATLTYYFFWSWHFGTPSLLGRLPLLCFPLREEYLQAKLEALENHRSQLVQESGEPILPESLLAPARRPFEIFAAA